MLLNLEIFLVNKIAFLSVFQTSKLLATNGVKLSILIYPLTSWFLSFVINWTNGLSSSLSTKISSTNNEYLLSSE